MHQMPAAVGCLCRTGMGLAVIPSVLPCQVLACMGLCRMLSVHLLDSGFVSLKPLYCAAARRPCQTERTSAGGTVQ